MKKIKNKNFNVVLLFNMFVHMLIATILRLFIRKIKNEMRAHSAKYLCVNFHCFVCLP